MKAYARPVTKMERAPAEADAPRWPEITSHLSKSEVVHLSWTFWRTLNVFLARGR
jgi:hypothetical protein